MQNIKTIDVHRDIICFDASNGEVHNLSYYNKHHIHILVRSLISPLHVFDYDQVIININWKDKKKLYKATYDVLLLNNRKVKYSVCGITLTQGDYVARLHVNHLKD